MLHQVPGAGALVQHPIAQHRHPITDGECFFGIVGNDQAAGTTARKHGGQLAAQPQAHLHIEVREGFIEEHDGGARRQGPGQCEPLALAARKLVGITALQAIEPEQLQQPASPAAVLTAPQAKTGIAPGVEVGEQGVVLENHANAAALRWQPAAGTGHGAAVDQYRTALWTLKASDQAQQGGFAATGGSKQAHQFALMEG